MASRGKFFLALQPNVSLCALRCISARTVSRTRRSSYNEPFRCDTKRHSVPLKDQPHPPFLDVALQSLPERYRLRADAAGRGVVAGVLRAPHHEGGPPLCLPSWSHEIGSFTVCDWIAERHP